MGVIVRSMALGGARFAGWPGPYSSLGQGGFNGVISFADSSDTNYVGLLIAGTGNTIFQSAPKSAPTTYTVRTTPISTNNVAPICVVNDDLLFLGLNDGAAASRVYRFVPSTNTFTNTSFPSNSDSIGSIEKSPLESDILFISNLAGAGGTGGIWRYSISGNSYTQVAGSSIGGSWNLAAGLVRFSIGLTRTGNYVILAGVGLAANGANLWQSSNLATGPSLTWNQIAGAGVNGSWATGTKRGVYSLIFHGTIYASLLGGSGGDAEVWRQNADETWTQVGGDGLNSGWAAGTHTTCRNMVALGTKIACPVGGTVAGDAEGWQYDTSTGLWTQVAGDGIGSTWPNRTGIFGCALTRENRLIWFGGNNSASTAYIYDSGAVVFAPNAGGFNFSPKPILISVS